LVGALVDSDGNIVSSDSEKASLLNSYFASALLANNIGAILAQYRHIGSRLANITILGQCWCDIVVPM